MGKIQEVFLLHQRRLLNFLRKNMNNKLDNIQNVACPICDCPFPFGLYETCPDCKANLKVDLIKTAEGIYGKIWKKLFIKEL